MMHNQDAIADPSKGPNHARYRFPPEALPVLEEIARRVATQRQEGRPLVDHREYEFYLMANRVPFEEMRSHAVLYDYNGSDSIHNEWLRIEGWRKMEGLADEMNVELVVSGIPLPIMYLRHGDVIDITAAVRNFKSNPDIVSYSVCNILLAYAPLERREEFKGLPEAKQFSEMEQLFYLVQGPELKPNTGGTRLVSEIVGDDTKPVVIPLGADRSRNEIRMRCMDYIANVVVVKAPVVKEENKKVLPNAIARMIGSPTNPDPHTRYELWGTCQLARRMGSLVDQEELDEVAKMSKEAANALNAYAPPRTVIEERHSLEIVDNSTPGEESPMRLRLEVWNPESDAKIIRRSYGENVTSYEPPGGLTFV